MKTAMLAVTVISLVSGRLLAQGEQPETIQAAALNQRAIIGSLGIPLGRCAEIAATVVSGDDLKTKAHAGQYLLRVEIVDGKKLRSQPIMTFSVPGFSTAKIANDSFALYEMRKAKKAKTLSSSEVEDLEKGYVGSKVRLLVYESGCFRGIPKGLPKDAPIWQDTGFHFSTYLVVLKQRD